MTVPSHNPLSGFVADSGPAREIRYEAKILRYLLARYNVSKHVKDQLYDMAEQARGTRTPTLDQLERLVDLPIVLRSRCLYKPQERLHLASALNGKALSGQLGKLYRDIRDSFPDLLEMNYVIGMCFEYPYLKTPGSATSLVLHDAPPTLDEIAELPGIICCRGDNEREVWVIEPLGQLLARLDDNYE